MERHTTPDREPGVAGKQRDCELGCELDARLERLAVAGLRQGAPPEVRQRLLEEVKLRAARSSQPQAGLGMGRLSEPRISRWRASGWHLAALPVVAAVFLLILSEVPSSRQGSFLQRWKGAPSASRSLRPVNAADDSALLSSANYVSLPYSDPSIANGTETMVSVAVSPSQLMAWGVPSDERAPDEDVSAVLVLGDDGLPRAIRILPASSSSIAEEIYP